MSDGQKGLIIVYECRFLRKNAIALEIGKSRRLKRGASLFCIQVSLLYSRSDGTISHASLNAAALTMALDSTDVNICRHKHCQRVSIGEVPDDEFQFR